MNVEIESADVVLQANITKDGRIYGLLKYAGREVRIVVLNNK